MGEKISSGKEKKERKGREKIDKGEKEGERRKGDEGDRRFLPLIYGVPKVRIRWTKD